MKEWNSSIYAFFDPISKIKYVDSWWSHIFKCFAKCCNHNVCCYLDKSDKVSTGNMCKHIHSCWGEAVINQINDAKDLDTAWKVIQNHAENGTISVAFEWKRKGSITYMHLQHTRSETRCMLVHVCGC